MRYSDYSVGGDEAVSESIIHQVKQRMTSYEGCNTQFPHSKDECRYEMSVVPKPLPYREVRKGILSDEASFTQYMTRGEMHIWLIPREQYRP